MEIHEALGLYLVQLDADGRAVTTRRQAERHVRLLAQWLRETGRSTDVRVIGHEDLAAFLSAPVARMRPDGKPKKATATNALRSSARTFFSFVHAAGYAPLNAARLVRRAMCSPGPARGLTREEQDRLLAVLAQATGEAGERDRVFFGLMLATGIRVGSALALDVEDVDLERGELLLRTTKGDRPFVVYINDRVRDLLRGYIGERVTGPLWGSRHGLRLSSRQVARRLWYWLARAGCRRASCHSLRHARGQRVYEQTGDPYMVMAALGHRSIASSLAYVRVDERRVRALLET